MNKEIKSLNANEEEKISGGRLTEEQMKKYYPNISKEIVENGASRSNPEYNSLKEYRCVSKCTKCGKEYLYWVGMAGTMHGSYYTNYCDECRPPIPEK